MPRTVEFGGGLPNYKQACITVPSGLCIDKWRMYLEHYDLKIICEYLQFGFPLNMDYQLFKFSEDTVNHASVIQKSDGVDKYFEDELGHGARVGPFDNKAFGK